MVNNRFDWADFMRGIMMFLVILYHSEVYYGTGHSLSWIFAPFFLSGFFFISGYLFSNNTNNVDFVAKIKQVIRSIIVPYFFFTIIMALPKVLSGHARIYQLLIDIILLRASWFVITIGILQLIYAFLLSRKQSLTRVAISTSAMFIIGYMFVLLYRDVPSWLHENRWLNSPELPNRLPLCINLAFVQSPFFLFGLFFRRYENKCGILLGKIGFLVPLLLYVILYVLIDHKYWGSGMCVAVDEYENILLVYIYAMIGIWSLMCFSRIVQQIKLINYIGKHSILFYFLNGGALTIVSVLMKRFPYFDSNLYWNQILVAIIATVVMFPMVWLINKYLPLLRGDKKAFNRLSSDLEINIKW